jgi:cytochrome P450
MHINSNTRSVSLDPRDPTFVQDTYAAYDVIRELGPAFKWEQYGHWCFPGFDDVNALLRDRRFGRQILHVATRAELGWPEPPDHIKSSLITNSTRCWNLNHRFTRACAVSLIALSCRARWSVCDQD